MIFLYFNICYLHTYTKWYNVGGMCQLFCFTHRDEEKCVFGNHHCGGDAGGGMDIGALAGQLVGGGVGGLIVQTIVGMIKNKMA